MPGVAFTQHAVATDELQLAAGGARLDLGAVCEPRARAGAVRHQHQRRLALRRGAGSLWLIHPVMMPESTGAGHVSSKDHLIWIDLEMTGLRPDHDSIIEIATVVTDRELNVVAEGPALAIHQSEPVLAAMDEWNQRQHGGSGLLARVRASRIDVAAAERQTLAFLAPHVPAGASPMCGNSICQDRRFLARWMPALEAHFHYRNIDVSTLKELALALVSAAVVAVQQARRAPRARRHPRVDCRTAILPRTHAAAPGVTQFAARRRPRRGARNACYIRNRDHRMRPGRLMARAPARLRRADGAVREQLPAPGAPGGELRRAAGPAVART